jgi:hypothetical protein
MELFTITVLNLQYEEKVTTVMVNNSININKTTNITSHLNFLKKKTTTYNISNSGLGLGQTHKCGGVKKPVPASRDNLY